MLVGSFASFFGGNMAEGLPPAFNFGPSRIFCFNLVFSLEWFILVNCFLI